MNTTATNNIIDSTMASYPIAEARQSVLRSINSIDDSQVMLEVMLAVNRILDDSEKRKQPTENLWSDYPISEETMSMTLKHRRNIPDDYDELLKRKLKEKYL